MRPVVQVPLGARLAWPALALDVLGPQHPPEHVDPDDGTQVNDGSVVLRATTAAGSVLLSGDVEVAAQAQLLAAGVPLHADVLKMPHHGSPLQLARSSSPPSRRGRCWSASARATCTTTRTPACSAVWSARAWRSGGPTGPATWP